MPLPLEGVKVLDLTNVLSGPLCSYQLVMLGADVLKVERPVTGDLARRMGADPKLGARKMGASFCSTNAGKKSITLNIKDERGKEIFKKLVKTVDVVLENFRPGVMKKLGLDYPMLKKINPGLIYCAISGFGQDGPLAERPSYDQIIQGYSGIMSVTGDRETAPLRAGYAVCDTTAGITAAFAVAASLYRKQKTGAGEMIDVPMLDAALASMAWWVASNYLIAGKIPVPMGNENHSASPSGTYRIRGELLNIVNNEQQQYEKLCDVIGLPELKRDARFAQRDARIKHRELLHGLVESALQAKDARAWEALFEAAGVPAGPVLSVPEIMAHPQVKARQLVKHFDHVPGIEQAIDVIRPGFRFMDGQPDVDSPPPQLGEHTSSILHGLGLLPEEITRLQEDGVV